MPANLTPQYHDAEERYKRATDDPERLQALEEMLRAIPKHKGTEKMQADIKRRMARLRKGADRSSSTAAARPDRRQVAREGAGQIVLCGPPNAGKSQLLGNLTHARPEIQDYPYTTRTPLPGMMAYQDIQIQLVDTVPLAADVLEPWHLALIEKADAVVLMFDVCDPSLLDHTDFVLRTFEQRGLALAADGHPPVIVLGNKVDRPGGMDEFEVWQEFYAEQCRAEPFSAVSEGDLLQLKKRLFKILSVVRVYTKAPGKKPDPKATPFILPQGGTVLDLAAQVHHSLARDFKYAKVWNEEGLDGLMIERGYALKDGDLVEIHT